MNYGHTDEEWEDIDQGKWNDRYFDVAKRHIEVGNIHFPHLKYLIKLVERQREEIIRIEKEKLDAYHNGYRQGAFDEKMSGTHQNHEDYEIRGFSEEDSFTKKMLSMEQEFDELSNINKERIESEKSRIDEKSKEFEQRKKEREKHFKDIR